MPVLDIQGQKVTVDDSFLKLSPDEQNQTVEEIASSLKMAPAAPADSGAGDVTANNVVRAAGSGVPIVGGLLNKANAATNAALAPVVEPFLEKGPNTLDQPTFGERYAKSLEVQQGLDKAFEEKHPVVSTAAKVAGAVGGMAPAVMAAPAAFGAVGTLPQMIAAGGASGAAIDAADALVRGEDPLKAAAIGAMTGGAAGPVAKVIGKGATAVRDMIKGAPVPVAQNVAKVAGVDVPLSSSQVTGDAVQSGEEQLLLKGGRGEKAQKVAQTFQKDQEDKIKKAADNVAASLDPTAQNLSTSPNEAGEHVINELTANEMLRSSAETNAARAAAAQGEQLRGELGTAGGAVQADTPFAAAESVGTGVERARDAAVARTKALYGAVRDEPGTFEPGVVKGLSEDIRTRLNTGDDPLFVDPQTTSKANEALNLIDQTVGKGLFKNAAAARPVGPVAQAAAETGSTVDQIRARYGDKAAARYEQTVAKNAAATTGSALDPHSVALPNGESVDVAPKVVEAAQIKTSADKGYNQSLQPRDRGRAASDAQIREISQNLNPARLGVSSEADRGAPIIGPDSMVESGNGRVLAIRQAYQEGGPAAAKYRDWLQSQGVDVSKFKEPVLVRERTTPMNAEERKAFTVGANQSATLSLSAPERALADARALTPDSLSMIRNPADLGAVENRDFIRNFMNTVPAAERGALMTADGDLSSEGLTRVRNAVLGKAYGDTPILSRIAESTTDDIKSISNALTAAAPEWAQLRAAITAGRVPKSLDVTPDLLDAVERTARIRGKGVGLADSHAQGDAFSQQTAESKQFQRMFYDADGARAAPAAQVSSALRNYAQEASKVDAAPGLDLGLAPVTAKDILENTAAKVGAPKELAASVAEMRNIATAAETGPEVGLKEMDAARKRLVTMFGDAKSAALRTGDRSDMRAMGKILGEFDNAILDAFDAGKFSGDSETAKALLRDARASHALYRQTFTSRGAGDEIGRAVEKIVGRYTDTRATPDEIARLSYGPANAPGGGKAIKVAQRLKSILGPTSPEWGAYKQGLYSQLVDVPEGASRSPAQIADRIDKFLTGTEGRGLAAVVYSPAERDALRSYSSNLRTTEPVDMKGLNTVDRLISRIAGRDGGLPATPGEVADLLYSRTGTGAKGISVNLAARLKNELSPDGWTAVRQGMWSKLTSAGEGKIPFEAQAMSQRLHEFLNESGKSLATVLFSPAERQQMAILAKTYKQMIPVKGTTNPSGTAPMLAKIASKASNHVLAMLGGIHGGFAGAAAGMGAEKVLKAGADRSGVRSAVKHFYGDQPKVAAKTSRVPIILTQAVTPLVANQR